MAAKLPVLLTFSPMVDSECTRRIIQYYGLDHVERDRLFGWVSLLTFLHGGYGRVPLFYGRGFALSGPRAVVDHLDGKFPARRLLPPDEPRRQQIEAAFALYNNELALDVAAVAYFHLLKQRDAMIESFGKPVTPAGRRALPVVYGALRALFSLLLRLRPERIDDATLRVEALLDYSDRSLRAGQKYLVGDSPTLADFGMMSAMAPIVLPPAYAPRVPDFAKLPVEFQAIVTRARKRPSGRFVMRLYQQLAPQS